MRWSTHPLLSRHNTFTFRFLPGVLVGIAVSWWLNDRPRQVKSCRSAPRMHGQRCCCVETSAPACANIELMAKPRRSSERLRMAQQSLCHSDWRWRLPLSRNLRRS